MFKKSFFILAIVIFCFIFGTNGGYAYNPDITGYHTEIEVQHNRKCNVSEYIKAYFYSPMQGITKIIPSTGYYLNKTKANEEYYQKISDIRVNKAFSIHKDSSNNKYIEIGEKNKYVNGEQKYIINYTYKLSGTRAKDLNKFYFNLVDTTWSVPVSNYSFKIIMPKDFNENAISFYDKFGKSSSVQYKVNNNIIDGYYDGILYPNDFLSINIELPNNYFERTYSEIAISYINKLIYCIPFLILFIVAIMWYIYDKNGDINKIYDGTPPNDFNAIDLAYICYHNIDTNFIPSLLLHLANKGFLKIEEAGILKNNNDFKIVKIKDYDGVDICEKIFMNTLFSKKRLISTKDISKIKNELNSCYKKIIENTKEKLKDIFDNTSLDLKNRTAYIMLFTWILACIFVGINIGFGIFMIALITLPAISYFILSNGIFQFIQKRKNALWVIFFGCIISILTFATVGYAVLIDNIQFTIGYFNTLMCIIGMDILRNWMPYVSEENCILYGKILGFKKFIEKSDINKIQKLNEKDPDYCYNILPYAYAFGLYNKWTLKMKAVNCKPPAYYSGKDYQENFLDTTLNNALNRLSFFNLSKIL